MKWRLDKYLEKKENKMNSSPKSNKSHSESLKRCRTESSSIGFIDDNTE